MDPFKEIILDKNHEDIYIHISTSLIRAAWDRRVPITVKLPVSLKL